ncbi:colicin E5-related ribonuclease [Acinetobacter baumannii]|uniref:colicin E5-related ribonuclease n=1 Tax=Acinetobacter baumannii TaxID=470 RepID=UPI000598CF3B|nr:colicin E5-related ribonuclease [Acinetobacter baumannii]KII22058.1 hypothetical protein PK64_19825 [Acinetobacter baumannii]KQF58952.1 hypothetical protein APC15_12085 [Acinetobacter baumannii]MDC4685554.1 colicin E5-related ribonuclease [Acinetobacter baumannii]MDH1310529.1 colicin E5-related ribonuclease [Acinetobacter baumannii]MDN8242021.1 colicin E5-related ribonuclease [Acinetobacter baumannii]
MTSVTTDTARENSGALQNNFDKDKVLKEINTQVSVTQKFGENAPKAVADYAQKQALILRAQGNEAEAKKWDEGGIYRVAMHTALGALGTGTLEGAITTGTVAASAPKINDFQNSVAQALTHTGMSEKAAEAVASGVTSLTLAGVGVASGLNTGSTATAVNVDANNRQLHVDEAKVLKKLTEGKTEVEQTRLRAAACALVHCSEGVPESDVNYKTLKAFEALGKTYIKEQNALKATGLFTYSNWDKANDIRTNHDEAVTRVGGAGKVITGGVTAIGGSAAGAGLCTTGLGCAVGAPLAGVSVVGGVSTAIEGKNQVFGEYTSQEGKKVIDSYNPNRKQELSQLSQDGLNGAVAVAEAVLIGKVGAKLSGSEAKVSSSVTSKLNPTFTIDPKIENQMSTRGWSNKDIADVMKKGPVGYTIDKRRASKTPDNLPRNDTATVYGSKNGYVVVNDRTKEVVQISDKTDKNWIPDSRIQWK